MWLAFVKANTTRLLSWEANMASSAQTIKFTHIFFSFIYKVQNVPNWRDSDVIVFVQTLGRQFWAWTVAPQRVCAYFQCWLDGLFTLPPLPPLIKTAKAQLWNSFVEEKQHVCHIWICTNWWTSSYLNTNIIWVYFRCCDEKRMDFLCTFKCMH